MAISVLCHPFCTGQMAVECMSRAHWFGFRIDVKHEARHFSPVSLLCVRIKQTQIGDDVLLVIGRQRQFARRYIRDIRIYRRSSIECLQCTSLSLTAHANRAYYNT